MNKMTIPFFSLARQTQALKPRVLEAFSNVLDSQQFIGGSHIAAIEQQLAEYLGVKHVISCNSGTDALWLAVKALNTKPGDLVLTTPFSFIASSSELIPHGAQPVFIDCEKGSFNLDVKVLQAWLETETTTIATKTIHTKTGAPVVGIIPVHLFGQSVDYAAIKTLANRYHLWIIEDTAQAIGTTFAGKKVGTLGDIGTYSFYPTKNLGAFGDAGCVVTNNTALAETLVRLRNHGRKSHYNYEGYGLNSRMDALQAIALSIKLEYIDTYNAQRRALADHYKQRLAHLGFLTLPHDIYGTHTYHQYSVMINAEHCGMTRDEVAVYLAQQGIETRVFYPQSLKAIGYLNENSLLDYACPVAELATQQILALPIWPELTLQEIDYVCDALERVSLEKQPTNTQQSVTRVLHG